MPIRSPDLKERAEDIPLLVESFVRECCDENGLGYKPVDEPVLERLKQYDWPGNVRELRNVVERLVIMSDEVIREKDLPPYLGGPRAPGQAARAASRARVTAIDLGRYAGKSLREFREEVESRVHPHPARRVRLEHLAHRAGARHRAHEPAQEAARARHPPRRRGGVKAVALALLLLAGRPGE